MPVHLNDHTDEDSILRVHVLKTDADGTEHGIYRFEKTISMTFGDG